MGGPQDHNTTDSTSTVPLWTSLQILGDHRTTRPQTLHAQLHFQHHLKSGRTTGPQTRHPYFHFEHHLKSGWTTGPQDHRLYIHSSISNITSNMGGPQDHKTIGSNWTESATHPLMNSYLSTKDDNCHLNLMLWVVQSCCFEGLNLLNE